MGSTSEKLSPDERKAIARKAAKERWEKARAKASIEVAGQINNTPIVTEDNPLRTQQLPIARWPGMLTVGASEIPSMSWRMDGG